MMSHHPNRALTDKQNVLNVFSKHFKTQAKTSIPTGKAASCCSSACSSKKTEIDCGTMHKVKRLKTRKERTQVRGGGQKHVSKSLHRYQHTRKDRKEKKHGYGCCSGRSLLPPPRRETAFAQALPPQETCIITESRLIGHHGLFNHEVKSIDIERLLSDQRKTDRQTGVQGGHSTGRNTSHTDSLPPSLPSASSPGPDSDTGQGYVSNHPVPVNLGKSPKRTTSDAKSTWADFCKSENRAHLCYRGGMHGDVRKRSTSTQVCLGDNDAASGNSQGSGSPAGQREADLIVLTSSESEPLLRVSSSPIRVLLNSSHKSRPEIIEKDQNTFKSLIKGSANKRDTDTRAPKDLINALTSEHTPKNTGFLNVDTQPCKPDHEFAMSSPPRAEAISSATSDARPQTERVSGPKPVSALAARLCQALELPLLRRRHLLAESREVLLQALQERHGPKLKENLLRVQQCLRFGQGQGQGDGGRTVGQEVVNVGAGTEEVWTDSSGFAGEGVEEQLWQGSQRGAPHKSRRRKQACPQRRSPPCPFKEPQQGTDMAGHWSTPAEQVQEANGGQLQPPSTQFHMDLQHSMPSSPNSFTPCASNWGAQPVPQRTWDDSLIRSEMRVKGQMDHFEKWRNDPDLSFLYETENQERNRQPSLQHTSSPLEVALREPRHWSQQHLQQQQQQQYDSERSRLSASSSVPAHCPSESIQLQPYYRFYHPHPPTSFTVRSYRHDMAFYPPSEMLERGLSPPLPPLPTFPSPEDWSFPRMKLY